MKFALPSHPETPHGLLRRSFDLYQHAWTHVFLLSLLLSIIAFLPRLFSLLVGQDIFLNLPLYSIQRAWLIILNLGALVFFVAILWRLHCLIIHKHEALEEDLKIGLIRLPRIFIAWIVQGLFISSVVFLISAFIFFGIFKGNPNMAALDWRNYLAIFFLFVQMGFILFIILSFYFYLALIVLENKGVFTSLAKSFKIVWKHWWVTVYVQSIPWLSYLLALIVLRFIINLNINIFLVTHARHQTIIDVLLNIFIFAAFLPWIATTLMVQLKDLEIRVLPRFQKIEDQDYQPK